MDVYLNKISEFCLYMSNFENPMKNIFPARNQPKTSLCDIYSLLHGLVLCHLLGVRPKSGLDDPSVEEAFASRCIYLS